MKFGKTFANHQVPAWQQEYMNYKALKKQIKTIAVLQREHPEAPLTHPAVKNALAAFFFALDRDIERVDEFYNRQYGEYDRRVRRLALALALPDDAEEVEDALNVLMDARSDLRNLRWFGELNLRGFLKILKKLDKKTGTAQRDAFIAARIGALPFASGDGDLNRSLAQVNLLLDKFGQAALETRPATPPLATTPYLAAIATDDSAALVAALTAAYQLPVLAPLRVLLQLLNRAAVLLLLKCIDEVLAILPTLSFHADVLGRNFFHHHIIALGRQSTDGVPARVVLLITPLVPQPRRLLAFGPDGVNLRDVAAGLEHVLSQLPVHLRPALLQRDSHRRTPLHYAAQYGLKQVTRLVVQYLEQWDVWPREKSVDDVEAWGDLERLTPLHLAVLGRHPLTVQVLTQAMHPTTSLTCPHLLVLAATLSAPMVVQVLATCPGMSLDFQDTNGETALYTAAKLNACDTVKALLDLGADPEVREASFGWTPVFVAAAENLVEVVQMLMAAGARIDVPDESGWLPMEHACLRGHLAMADMLKPLAPTPTNDLMYLIQLGGSSVDRLDPQQHRDPLALLSLPDGERARPVKLFGHSYLEPGELLVLVTLGSTDVRASAQAITLHKVPLLKIHALVLDAALLVRVLVLSSSTPPVVLDLPFDAHAEGSPTDPLSFTVASASPDVAMLQFDIVPTYQLAEGGSKVLGRAVARVGDLFAKVGPLRQALLRQVTLPLLSAETLDVLGEVLFECMVVRPFTHPAMKADRTQTYWRLLITTRVIGHRGLGKNMHDKRLLQLGENTMDLFIAAALLGALYVEFDVQLTKDHIPVVYHDFTVAESGVDVPMHALTAEQFLALHRGPKRRGRLVDDEPLLMRLRSKLLVGFTREQLVPRGLELDLDLDLLWQAQLRMRLTKTWKDKGFKGNTRGTLIALPFVTLAELFAKLPPNVGFNIECKYPMRDEAEQEDMGEVAVDINVYVDTVLRSVYDCAKGRDVIFLSFHPDVCVLLLLKQPLIPILFLTEAGTSPMADVRAALLQAAIRFSRKWNLLGIVLAADALVKCPRLALIVKASGLVCVTYGTENNDPENLRLQMDNGVDAVIVDSVLAVRSGLRKLLEQEK